jgi:hypothetical protein
MHAGTGNLQAWCEHAERPEEKVSRHTVRPGTLGLTLDRITNNKPKTAVKSIPAVRTSLRTNSGFESKRFVTQRRAITKSDLI